jgi:trehalose 6-phosphate phosphatase
LEIMYSIGMQDIPATGTTRLDGLLANADDWALFIDIDGTLLDMAATPDAVRVPPGLVQTLAQLSATFNGAVGLITGRRVADADRFFAPLKLAVSGVHGTEARGASGDTIMLARPVPVGLTAAACDIARAMPGILVEEKGAGLAIHYRNAPEARAKLELQLRQVIMGWEGYVLRRGRKVLDLVPDAHSKATGLAWLMRLPAFNGRHPVMIGDDHGDEPAIEAAETMGGIGLKVAGEHFSRDGADFASPARVRAWLESLCRTSRPQQQRAAR